MGDINGKYERWGGEGTEEDEGGKRVVEWMDNWEFKLDTKRGEIIRINPVVGGKDSVIDIGVWSGALEVEGKMREGIVGLDHIPIELNVKVLEGDIMVERRIGGEVDWEKFETDMILKKEWNKWKEERKNIGGRERLDKIVEELEVIVGKGVEENRDRRKWRMGKCKWWTRKVEEEHKRIMGVEKEYRRNRTEERKKKLEEEILNWKRMVEEKKNEYWMEKLEKIDMNEGYK
ncbi:hypothetical protein L873DRAFT_1792753 [Choiromyces venosus 120613-1]|uniref:Endonuclease/exonuclease/phosphatase domain-containing protein n=1 Tax=Choiromyces venosus 120613-1 TaxID=1336337 RepID=A0A3N4J8Q1_9PEZI|nr:hypothetical protein L873DRAFT_1792753 [Choiromyces venosus 120613-1]